MKNNSLHDELMRLINQFRENGYSDEWIKEKFRKVLEEI